MSSAARSAPFGAEAIRAAVKLSIGGEHLRNSPFTIYCAVYSGIFVGFDGGVGFDPGVLVAVGVGVRDGV